MKEDASLEVWSLVVWSVKILEETRDTSRVGLSEECKSSEETRVCESEEPKRRHETIQAST
jgi:hypothetical protein